MVSTRVQIRGYGFMTNELVARLATRPGVNQPLVHVFADTLHFASGLLSRLPVSGQETPEEKQKVVAVLMLVRLVEIAESTLPLNTDAQTTALRLLFVRRLWAFRWAT